MALLNALLRLSAPEHLAVATSGGPDSLALTLMLQDVLPHTPHTLTVLTVDHGLRAESAREAQWVHDYCTKTKINHVVLQTSHIAPGTMHHKARIARYDALVLWCHQQGVRNLFLGHHLDDQLETFLMRLRRQSGPYGLGGMLPRTPRLGIWLWRPFLHMSKKDILRCTRAYDAPFVCDPSNQNSRFERSRIRSSLPRLTPEERHFWLKEQAHYAAKKWALFESSEAFLSKNLTWTEGMAQIKLDHAPPYLWPHMLRAILEAVGGRNTSVLCFDRVCTLLNHHHKRHTLGGCLITFTQQFVQVQREWPRIQDMALDGREHHLWDDRFFVSLCPTARGHLRALGHSKRYTHLPYHLKGYPGLFHKNGTITPFWEASVFRRCDWIQEARFPQTQRTLQHGA